MGQENGGGFAQTKDMKALRKRVGAEPNRTITSISVEPREGVSSGIEKEVAGLATGSELTPGTAALASGMMFVSLRI